MNRTRAYADDLAYIHDTGFGDFARSAAPGLLGLLRKNHIDSGPVLDLGCGSGIWARELVDAGYRVIGVDISPAMIELARRRVPEAQLHVASFLRFRMPICRAVTALGEVFNYLFDEANALSSLEQLCARVFDGLTPGGLLIFDIAEPGRCKGRAQAFKEGKDWTCLVEYQHDDSVRQLSRRIITFRKVGNGYRRHEETHPQQLYSGREIARMLRQLGFRVRLARRYGEYPLPERVVAVVARKP